MIVGGGEQGDPAAVGRASDPDPRIARVVEQHPGLARQPGDELLDVGYLVVGRVQPDLAGGGAKTARRPGQDREPGPRQRLGLRLDSGLGLPEPVCEQHGGEPSVACGREERGVEKDPLAATRPVHDRDTDVANGERRWPVQRDSQDDAGPGQGGHGGHRNHDPCSRTPSQTHDKDASNARQVLSAPGGRHFSSAGPHFRRTPGSASLCR